MDSDRKICVGMIMSAHGVRGLVRLRSFTEDPESLLDYKKLSDEKAEKTFTFKIKTAAKDFFIAEIKGLANKEQADALRGTKLYVPRSALPKTKKSEFYEADLVGLAAQDKQGKEYGAVKAVHNYGGGPFLEIGRSKSDSFMLPFTDACVPLVDVKVGQVTIDLPEGWMKEEKPKEEEKAQRAAKKAKL
jgi:16S rRNA processing protein RimM